MSQNRAGGYSGSGVIDILLLGNVAFRRVFISWGPAIFALYAGLLAIGHEYAWAPIDIWLDLSGGIVALLSSFMPVFDAIDLEVGRRLARPKDVVVMQHLTTIGWLIGLIVISWSWVELRRAPPERWTDAMEKFGRYRFLLGFGAVFFTFWFVVITYSMFTGWAVAGTKATFWIHRDLAVVTVFITVWGWIVIGASAPALGAFFVAALRRHRTGSTLPG